MNDSICDESKNKKRGLSTKSDDGGFKKVKIEDDSVELSHANNENASAAVSDDHNESSYQDGSSDENTETTTICHICDKEVDDLMGHLVVHYRTSTSATALMECRFCWREYRAVEEVLKHENKSHSGKLKSRKYNCSECAVQFNSSLALTNHLLTFLDEHKLIESFIKPSFYSAGVLKFCPICKTSRNKHLRRFKEHIITSHFRKCLEVSSLPSTGFNVHFLHKEIKQEEEEHENAV